MNRCKTGLGEQTLRRWMMRPLTSLPHLLARHQAVEVLIRPENRQILKTIRDHMKAIKNIHYIFNKLKSGDLEDWVCWKNLADVSISYHFWMYYLLIPGSKASTRSAKHRRVHNQPARMGVCGNLQKCKLAPRTIMHH